MITHAYEVRDLAFGYNGTPVLEIESLTIPTGNIVALVGPNGSGKTTLLHMLAFLEAPQRGIVKLFGERQTSENLLTLRRKASLLLQTPYLFHDTVLGLTLTQKFVEFHGEKSKLKARGKGKETDFTS